MPVISLEDLQGRYEISYQSTPQMPDWYEPGVGVAQIVDNQLHGVDAVGVSWFAEFDILNDGTLSFQAKLDPTNAPPNSVLLDRNGQMTRTPQDYTGILRVTKLENHLILRTQVIQGPITINVQFKKVS